MGLHSLIELALKLWLDMRCQRGWYELDPVIQPGKVFSSDSMNDFKNSADPDEMEDGQYGYVTAIVAKGIVRKPYKGSMEIVTRITKARVNLAIEEKRSTAFV